MLLRTIGYKELMSTVKCLSVHASTEYGPSYVGCNGLSIASWRIKTCVAVARALLT